VVIAHVHVSIGAVNALDDFPTATADFRLVSPLAGLRHAAQGRAGTLAERIDRHDIAAPVSVGV
jgi:hypothetical protein